MRVVYDKIGPAKFESEIGEPLQNSPLTYLRGETTPEAYDSLPFAAHLRPACRCGALEAFLHRFEYVRLYFVFLFRSNNL